VALARALAKRPKVLLLDEPLAALDRRLREQTQFELLRIQDRLGTTFVVVTHDQEEAMTLATRIGVMERGGLVQVGTPLDVYEYPASRFVAEFIGSVNLFAGHVLGGDAGHTLIASPDTGGDIQVAQRVEAPSGTPCWVALRPEKIRLARERPHGGGRNSAHGRIDEIAYRGSISLYALTLDSGKTVQVTRPNLHRRHAHDLTWDEEVWLSWDAASAVVLLT
jgi:putrescine transport system ATP-binding protein